MKVICDRAAFSSALSDASGAVASRTPRPQLTCIKITASKDGADSQLTLTATDAEVAIRLESARVDVQRPGEALIPAEKLRQIVQAEDRDPTLTLEMDDTTCTITGEDSRFVLHGYDPKDFPPIPAVKEFTKTGVTTLSAGTLATMISQTIFATARENSRYAVNGVLMKREARKLVMAATDGRRLAISQSSVKGDAPTGPNSCIVPTKALGMLQKLLRDDEEPVSIGVTSTQVLFAVGGHEEPRATLTSILVEGTFPPYEDVVPKDHDKKIVLDRELLASAVKRAALLTNEDSRGVRMAFVGKESKAEFTSRAPEMGEARVNVPLNSYSGEDLEVGFNPSYLTDAIKVISDAEVQLELKNEKQAGILRPKTNNDFVYVVMPVSLT